MVDLDHLDLKSFGNRIRLTPEQRDLLGDLAKLRHCSNDHTGLGLVQEILEHYERAVRSRDVDKMVRGTFAAHECFTLLTGAGYPMSQFVRQLEDTLREMATLAIREIIRRMLTHPDMDIEGPCAALARYDQRWVMSMFDEVEAELTHAASAT